METTLDDSLYPASKRAAEKLKNEFKDGARTVKDTATDEFKKFVSDLEDVIKNVAHASDADVAKVRAKIEGVLSNARDGVATSAAQLKRQARQAATQADDYVHDRPWQALGAVAALAAIIGLSVGYFSSRR
jgi:ElaB protein